MYLIWIDLLARLVILIVDNETNHRVELSGVWKFIQFMVNYKDSRNAIIYWAEQISEDEAITMISRKNVKSLKSMTAYISAAPKIGIWAPQINLGMQKPWFILHTDVASYRLNRPIFMGNFNNAFSLPCGITLDVDYRYQFNTTRSKYKGTGAGNAELNRL